jgi:hypothetical protein
MEQKNIHSRIEERIKEESKNRILGVLGEEEWDPRVEDDENDGSRTYDGKGCLIFNFKLIFTFLFHPLVILVIFLWVLVIF